MKRLLTFFVILFIISNTSYSQLSSNETINWYFGNRCGITFKNGKPENIDGNTTNTYEGTLTVSDKNGNFIFFSNGRDIYDRNWSVMPNGSGLKGNPSSTINVLPIKQPGAEHLYYFFTVGIRYVFSGDPEVYPNLEYGIIDMSRNNGLGEVIRKNIKIADDVTEKMIAVYADCRVRWLVIRQSTGVFLSFKIDNNGLHEAPIESKFSGGINNSCATCARGGIALSPDGSIVALANHNYGTIELFSFDKVSGKLAHLVNFDVKGRTSLYGVEFSPSGKKLYVSTNGLILQFDISSLNKSTIEQSQYTVYDKKPTTHNIKIGIDDKIYFALLQTSTLCTINNPDADPESLRLDLNVLKLKGSPNQTFTSTPYFLTDFADQKKDLGVKIHSNHFCDPDSIEVWIDNPKNYSVAWDIPDRRVSYKDTVKLKDLKDPIPGIYKVTIYDEENCTYDEKEIEINFSTIELEPGLRETCRGQKVRLSVAGDFESYKWILIMADSSRMIVAKEKEFYTDMPGVYIVECTDEDGCVIHTTVTLNQIKTPVANIRESLIKICPGTQVVLSSQDTTLENEHTWSTGEKGLFIMVDKPGVYFLNVSNKLGCYSSDTCTVVYHEPKPLVLSADPSIICEGDETTLSANEGFFKYKWSTGDKEREIVVDKPGVYSVEVVDFNGCVQKDTIEIKSQKFISVSIDLIGEKNPCNGKEIILKAKPKGNYTYLWSTGETTPEIVVTNAGQYSVTVNRGESCQGTASVIVDFEDFTIPNILATKSSFCTGDSALLILEKSYDSYLWSTGETTRSILVKEAGKYWARVTSGFCIDTAYFEIKVDGNLVTEIISESGFTNCNNEAIMLTATPNGDDYEYLWSTGEKSPSILADKSGSYSVIVTITGTTCTGEDSKEILITDITPLELEFGKTLLCGDDSTLISSKAQYAEYQWSTGETTRSIYGKKTGRMTLIVTDENGCRDTASVDIKRISGINASISVDKALPYCEGDTLILTAEPAGADTYLWSTGEKSRSIIASSTGEYSVTVSSSSCSDDADKLIVFNAKPQISLITDKTSICSGEETEIRLVNPKSNLIYEWFDGSTGNSVKVNQPGVYYATVHSTAGCSNIAEIEIMNSFAEISITPNDIIDLDSLHIGDYSEASVSIVNSSSAAVTGLIGYSNAHIRLDRASRKLEIMTDAEETLVFKYNRVLPQRVEDKLILHIDEPCDISYEIPVRGIAYANTRFTSIDTTADAGSNLCLPIFGQMIGQNSPSLTGSVELSISFNSALFGFKYFEGGEILSDKIIGSTRTITFRLNNIQLKSTKSVVAKLCGAILIDRDHSTKLPISDGSWDNDLIFTETNPGNITINSCMYDLSAMDFFNKSEISISPNPASDILKAKLYSENLGSIIVELINSEGKSLRRMEFNNEAIFDEQIEINMTEHSHGVYYLLMTSSGGIISKPVIKME